MADEPIPTSLPGDDVAPAASQREFPISLKAFQATLAKTHDEVWAHLLGLTCKGQNHTPTEWREILAQLRTRKV